MSIRFTAKGDVGELIALEKTLHRRFASKRLMGSEFFRLNERDLEYLRQLADED